MSVRSNEKGLSVDEVKAKIAELEKRYEEDLKALKGHYNELRVKIISKRDRALEKIKKKWEKKLAKIDRKIATSKKGNVLKMKLKREAIAKKYEEQLLKTKTKFDEELHELESWFVSESESLREKFLERKISYLDILEKIGAKEEISAPKKKVKPIKRTLKGHLTILWMQTVSSIKIFVRYPINFIWLVLIPIFSMVVLATVMGLIDWETFSALSGGVTRENLPGYIFIGMGMLNLSTMIINTSGQIRGERAQGLLEPTFVTPIPRIMYILGIVLGSLATSGIFSLILVLIGIAWIATTITPIAALTALLILVLSILNNIGLGLIIAALTLRFHQIDPILTILSGLILFASGAFIPVTSLGSFAIIVYLIPQAWQIDAFRSVLMNTTPLQPLYIEVLIIVGFTIISWIIGIYLFNYMEKSAKKAGLLHLY